MPAFELRIRELCSEVGKSPSRLGMDAGLSKDTVNKWIREARSGIGPSPSLSGLRKLAEFYGKAPGFFLTAHRSEEPADTPRAISGEPESSLDAARIVVDMLEQLDGISRSKGWDAIDNIRLHKPTVQSLYSTARAFLGLTNGRLNGESLNPAPRGKRSPGSK